MAGQDIPADPAKALECKEKGNKCFQAGDYIGAEALYSKAWVPPSTTTNQLTTPLPRINYDPTNPLLYTNRSLALLKLSRFPLVITDSLHAISLSPPPSTSMKAYFQLAQAQIALHNAEEALESAKIAHKLCVDEVISGGKGGSSIGPITELVLRCKKERWEEREEERLRRRGGLLGDLIRGLERDREAHVGVLRGEGALDAEIEGINKKFEMRVEELKRTFELAGVMGEEGKRRKVPDWCLDDITFSVMLDPVVVRCLPCLLSSYVSILGILC
jgi:STIP1 family protein 1